MLLFSFQSNTIYDNLFCFDYLEQGECPTNHLVKNLLQIKLQTTSCYSLNYPTLYLPMTHKCDSKLTCQGTSTTVHLPDCRLPACWYYLIASYSSSCNLTPPFPWVLIGRHVIFLKSTPSKYKARQKAGFPVITYITLLLRVVLSIYQAA